MPGPIRAAAMASASVDAVTDRAALEGPAPSTRVLPMARTAPASWRAIFKYRDSIVLQVFSGLYFSSINGSNTFNPFSRTTGVVLATTTARLCPPRTRSIGSRCRPAAWEDCPWLRGAGEEGRLTGRTAHSRTGEIGVSSRGEHPSDLPRTGLQSDRIGGMDRTNQTNQATVPRISRASRAQNWKAWSRRSSLASSSGEGSGTSPPADSRAPAS